MFLKNIITIHFPHVLAIPSAEEITISCTLELFLIHLVLNSLHNYVAARKNATNNFIYKIV